MNWSKIRWNVWTIRQKENCKWNVVKTISGLIPVSIWHRHRQLPQLRKQNGGRRNSWNLFWFSLLPPSCTSGENLWIRKRQICWRISSAVWHSMTQHNFANAPLPLKQTNTRQDFKWKLHKLQLDHNLRANKTTEWKSVQVSNHAQKKNWIFTHFCEIVEYL